MAIGTLTVDGKKQSAPSQTTFIDAISLVGDGAYPTGGSTGVQAALRAKTGDNRTILGVIPIGLNGGYLPVWDLANGKLIMLTTDGTAAPPVEVANAANLSGTTFKLLVISQ